MICISRITLLRLHWPRRGDLIFMEQRIVCGQTTSGLGDFVTNVALVEAVHVHLHMALQVLLPGHCLATVSTGISAIFIPDNHRFQGFLKVWWGNGVWDAIPSFPWSKHPDFDQTKDPARPSQKASQMSPCHHTSPLRKLQAHVQVPIKSRFFNAAKSVQKVWIFFFIFFFTIL